MLRSVIAILFLSTSAFTQSHTLKLDDLVSLALKHSPDLHISRLDLQSARARSKGARSFYLPTLNLSAAGGKQYSKLRHQSGNTLDLLTGTLSASQLIYDFGKTSGQIEAADEQLLSQNALVYQSVADKILQVKQRYYEILKAQGIVEVQRKNVALQRQQLKRAQRYLEAGIKTIIDVTDAKVRLEQAKRDLENARYRIRLLRAQLEQIIGTTPYGGDYRLYNPHPDINGVSHKLPKVHTPLSQLEQFAYRHRPLLESSGHQIKSAKAILKSTRGDYLPSLSVGGDYTTQKVDDTLAGFLPQTQSHIALNLRWNLFSGFRTDAAVEEAKIGVLKSASQQQNIRLGIRRQVDEAYISLRQSRDNITLNNAITASAKKKLYQAQKRYENGLSDFIELQNAQQDYINALTTLVNSYYDYYIALAQLDYAVGR